jgi:FAD/FMN-containing dehydrogenase
MRRHAPAVGCLTAQAQLAGYEADGLAFKRFRPDAVAIPADTGELVALVKALREGSTPLRHPRRRHLTCRGDRWRRRAGS